MNCLILTAALALGLDPQQTPPKPASPNGTQPAATAVSLDGTWHVLLAEKDGQKVNTQSQSQTVTIKGNVLTWNKDGAEHRVQLQFGANHMLAATPETMHEGHKAQSNTPAHQQTTPAAQNNQQPGQSTVKQSATQPAAKPGEQPPAQANNNKTDNQPKPAEGTPRVGAAVATASPTASPSHFTPQATLHGVYIKGNDFLCLTLNQCFMEDKPAQAAANTPKPGTPATANPTATTGRPAAPATASGAASTNGNAKPQGGATTPAPTTNTVASNQQPGQTPNAAPLTGAAAQAEVIAQMHAAARQANYGPMGTMESHDFVLILQRQATAQQENAQPRR
jgi:hypothetical protein